MEHCLVNESFVPATQRTRVLYWRLSDLWLAIPIFFVKKRSSLKKNNLNVFLIRFWRHWVLFSQDIWHVGFFFVFMYLLSASIWCNLPLSWWTYNYVGICKKKYQVFYIPHFLSQKNKRINGPFELLFKDIDAFFSFKKRPNFAVRCFCHIWFKIGLESRIATKKPFFCKIVSWLNLYL